MSFHNGIPITVVSSVQRMATPTDAPSRRRTEEQGARIADDSPIVSRAKARTIA